MSKKLIIAVYGRQDEGKSETIRRVYDLLMQTKPTPVLDREVPIAGDILVILTMANGLRIGIESQGDPKSRMIYERTVRHLAELNCDIIICASRTRGETVWEVDIIANEFGYSTLWISSYFGAFLNHSFLNDQLAHSITNIVQAPDTL